MRLVFLLTLVAACAHAPPPAPRCDLPEPPAWVPAGGSLAADGGVYFTAAEAALLSQDIRATRDWNGQAAACLNAPEADAGH